MANFTERIKIIVDVVTDSAKTGLGNFKSAVAEAETTTGKFKAGATSAFDTVKANAGALALGAGAALVTFGIKAVGAFTETAKSAIDLSTATGLSIDQASRWIAVGDDFQVSAEALQTGLGKISKTLDDTKWKEYGIATRDAGGEARPVNDILLDTFDMLSKISNQTERARVGQQLFGKGYQSLTPILGKTRAEYEKMLGAVEKGQVITEGEAAKAEKMRLAEDDLSDALKEVSLAFGAIGAEAAPVLTFFADLIIKATEAKDALTRIPGIGGPLFDTTAFDIFGKAKDAFTGMIDSAKDVVKYGPFATEEQQKQQDWAERIKNLVVPSINDLDTAHKNLADGGIQSVEDAEYDAATAMTNYGIVVDGVTAQVKRDLDETKAKWDAIHNTLSREQAWIQLQQQAVGVKTAFEEAGKVAKEKGPTSPEAIKAAQDAQLELINLKQKVTDYGEEVLGLPPEKVTTMLTEIDPNNLTATLAEMDRAFLNHTFRVNAHLDSIVVDGETHAAGSTQVSVTVAKDGTIKRSAEGGVFKAQPGGHIVNIAEAGRDEAVIPLVNGQLPGAVGGPVTIIQNFPPGISPVAVAQANREYHRRGGRAA